MDKIVATVAGLGIPGLVLLVAVSASGFSGAAALTTALAALGGPLGMLGGIALLGVLVVMFRGISKYGFDKIYEAVIKNLLEKGETKDSILEKIENYPISKDLKRKLKELLEN